MIIVPAQVQSHHDRQNVSIKNTPMTFEAKSQIHKDIS